MGLKAIVIVTAILLSFSAPSKAEFYTGNEMYGYCTSKKELLAGMCIGLAGGYFDGFIGAFRCNIPTENVTIKQVQDIIMQYLTQHPELRHLQAVLLAYRSFVIAFDCTLRKT